MRDQERAYATKDWRTSAPPSAIEHISNELKQLRAPSPAVIAQAIRDALSAHAEAEQAASTTITEIKAGLTEDFYAFLQLHSGTAAFDKLTAKKGQFLHRTLASAQEVSDEQN